MSKPFKYILAVLGVIAVGLGLWQVYNIFFANSGGETEVVTESPAATGGSPSPAATGESPAATGGSPSPTTTGESPAATESPATTGESPATTESPAAVAAPANAPTSEVPFYDAVKNAQEAANLTQTAKTKEEWQKVATLWQNAIALMKAVPEGESNYKVAQEKVGEYGRNLQYAQKNAGN